MSSSRVMRAAPSPIEFWIGPLPRMHGLRCCRVVTISPPMTRADCPVGLTAQSPSTSCGRRVWRSRAIASGRRPFLPISLRRTACCLVPLWRRPRPH